MGGFILNWARGPTGGLVFFIDRARADRWVAF